MSLLVLWDDMVFKVCSHLGPRPEVMGPPGYRSEDARALAVTNSRRNSLYRHVMATRLEVPAAATPDEVQRALRRYPRVDAKCRQ